MDKVKKIIEKIENNNWYVFISFFLIALVVYSPSLFNLNFFWDDERFVFMNPKFVNSPSWTYFWNIRSDMFKVWPFGYTVFWVIWKVFSSNLLLALKVINIFFHSLNAFFLLKLFKKLNIIFSLSIALLFLVHPLNVENVSWIFQLLTIMSFTFFLLSFAFILDFLRKEQFFLITISFIFFSLSILTKGIALLAPFFFLFLFLAKKAPKKLFFFLIPFFLMSLFLGLMTQKGTEDISGINASASSQIINHFFDLSHKEIAPQDNLLISESYFDFIFRTKRLPDAIHFNKFEIFSQSIIHYPLKMLIPVNLHFLYKSKPLSLVYVFAFLILILLCSGYAYKKTRDNKLILLYFYTLIFMLPYCGITFITFFYWSNVSDRYTYYLIPAFCFFIGILIKHWNNYNAYKILNFYILILIFLNTSYGIQFNNYLKLYQDTIEQKEHPAIYSLLFEQYLYRLDLKNGEKTLMEGIKKFPKDDMLQGDLIRLESLRKFYNQ
jgi:hypothetical protein